MPRGRRLDPATIRELVGPPAGIPTDADLLARFVADRDATAFELLLRRHAALVFGTCRRILIDPNDADDAFQATFLVLARKARSVTRTERLSHWLYRVACRAALRVRSSRERRARREQGGPIDQPATPVNGTDRPELARVLDEEVGRLPARHRAAFVLCCLEGKTGAEAAAILGCPPGTVSSRLTRARVRLRDRLTRRGIVPAALVAVSLPREAPAVLIDRTLHTCLGLAAARPAAIANGVTRAMLLNKVRFVPLLVAGLLAAGVTLVGTGAGAGPVPPKAVETPVKEEVAPPTVAVVRARPGGLERVAQQPCKVVPLSQVQLYSQAAGQVKSIAVDLGDRVKVGQVVAEIDAPDLVLAVRQAETAVEQATGLLKAAEAGTAVARADVVTAESMLKQRQAELAAVEAALKSRQAQFERIKRLWDAVSVDQAAVDVARDQFDAAKGRADAAAAGLENAKAEMGVRKAKVAQAEAGVATERANVAAARIGLERAQLAVSRTQVRSLTDGVVTRRDGQVGEAVRGELGASPPLVTVVQTDVVRVVAAVPERYAAVLRPGAAAELTFENVPGVRVSTKVLRAGFVVDPSDRTIQAVMNVPNPDGLLRPGMVGEARLRLGVGPADAVRIPVGATWHLPRGQAVGDARWAVYVVRDGKARLTPVRIDYMDETDAEVRSGLKADDVIVTDPGRLGTLAGRAEVPVVVAKPEGK